MTRISDYQLRSALPQEEFDYLRLSSALSQYSGVRQKIHDLLKSGIIIRVKKGLYVFAPTYNQSPVCKETLANLIYGPSCISLEYALSYYGLIPEQVHVVTSVTPNRDKEFETPLGRFTYRYLGAYKYSYSIEQIWVDPSHPILMASPEKALCDYLVLNKVRSIDSIYSASEFLEFDLRIDRSKWKQFSVRNLSRLNRFYQSTAVRYIQKLL